MTLVRHLSLKVRKFSIRKWHQFLSKKPCLDLWHLSQICPLDHPRLRKPPLPDFRHFRIPRSEFIDAYDILYIQPISSFVSLSLINCLHTHTMSFILFPHFFFSFSFSCRRSGDTPILNSPKQPNLIHS